MNVRVDRLPAELPSASSSSLPMLAVSYNGWVGRPDLFTVNPVSSP